MRNLHAGRDKVSHTGHGAQIEHYRLVRAQWLRIRPNGRVEPGLPVFPETDKPWSIHRVRLGELQRKARVGRARVSRAFKRQRFHKELGVRRILIMRAYVVRLVRGVEV